LNWLRREYPEHSTWNPLANIKQPKVDDEVLPPADDGDIRQMLQSCHGKRFTDVRDECLILALVDTGCRANEFISLRIKDVDQDTGDVSIRPSTAKGRRPRTVFLGQKSRKSMRRYLAERAKQGATPEDPLWVNQMGDPLKYYTLREVLRRRAQNSGLEREPSLHSFRRAFAIGWLRRGGDIETLRRLLGHKNLAVISRYLPLVNQDLQNAHRQYSPADRL